MIGFSLSTRGVAEVEARLSAIPVKADTAGKKALGGLGLQAGELLTKTILRQPQRTDSFWGVMGTMSPFGLGRRGGKTAQGIVATGQVYQTPDGGLHTFVGGRDRHLAQLEDGGRVSGSPFLKIPTKAAQKPAGDARWAPRERPAGSFIWPTRKMQGAAAGGRRSLWIVRRDGKRLEFLYLLKRSITHRSHRSFATLREMMAKPAQAALDGVGAEVARTA